MTIELGLCVVFMIAAFPVSKSVAAHYAAFALANLLTLGVAYADTSALSLLFCALMAIDAMIVMSGGRKILIVSAIASALLCIESIANMDWLLSRVTYLSAAVNTAIAASLAKEFIQWMRGNYGR